MSSMLSDWQRHVKRYPWWVLPVACWAILILIVVVRVSYSPKKSTIYPIFDTVGRAFSEGTPLYADENELYRYAPIWAAFFSLGNDLPLAVSSILWRLLNLAVFFWASFRFQRCFFPQWTDQQQGLWWVLLLPFCVGSFNNAQSNILHIGLLLAAMVYFAEKRYWLSGCYLAIATSLKIYPVSLALLLILVEPLPLLPAFVLFLGALGLAPYALQTAAYVTSEYQSWYNVSTTRLHFETDLRTSHRDAWLLARQFYYDCPFLYYQISEVVTAGLLALWTWMTRRSYNSPQSRQTYLLKLFNLAIFWMLVFGPATESSTYTLLAPLAAFALVMVSTKVRTSDKVLVTLSYITMVLALFSATMTWSLHLHGWGIHPIGAILLAFSVHRLLCASQP